MVTKEYNSMENMYLEEIIKNNKLKNLINFKINANIISYHNDGLISLNENLKGIVNIEEFIDIYKNIIIALYNLESYMIFEQNLYISKEDIFIDSEKNIFFLISMNNENKNIKTLYQSIINSVCFKITNKSNLLLEINNYFNTENYSIKGVLKIIDQNFFEENIDNESNNERQVKNIKEKKEIKSSFFSNWFKKKNQNTVNTSELDNIFKL